MTIPPLSSAPMASALFLLVASVALSPPFVEASAAAVPSPAGIEVTTRVAVQALPLPSAVVVHVVTSEGQQTFSLGEAGGGDYVGTLVVPAQNALVAYEALWETGESELSDRTTLKDLGVDADLLGIGLPSSPVEITDGGSAGRNWVWLAVALTATAMAVLVVWQFWPGAVTEPAGIGAGIRTAASGAPARPQDAGDDERPDDAGEGGA